MVLGISVLAANIVVGIWGALAWTHKRPSVWFWYLLRTAQALVVAQVTLGMILLATDHKATDELHYIYGISPLLVTLVTEGMRAGAAQLELEDVDVDNLTNDEQREIARRVVIREMGVMTVGALLIATLALRAATTGG